MFCEEGMYGCDQDTRTEEEFNTSTSIVKGGSEGAIYNEKMRRCVNLLNQSNSYNNNNITKITVILLHKHK